MSIPESILSSLRTDLAKITTANGYQNTFLTPYRGFLFGGNSNEDLKPFYFAGESDTISVVSAYNYGVIQLKLNISVLFTSDTAEGSLTDKCETILNDLLKWKSQDCSIGNIANVDFFYIQNQNRVFDWAQNSGTASIAILIQYRDSI